MPRLVYCTILSTTVAWSATCRLSDQSQLSLLSCLAHRIVTGTTDSSLERAFHPQICQKSEGGPEYRPPSGSIGQPLAPAKFLIQVQHTAKSASGSITFHHEDRADTQPCDAPPHLGGDENDWGLQGETLVGFHPKRLSRTRSNQRK